MAISKVLKPRRGSTTEHATFKGQAFEITFDTDKKTIVAHDGLTMGGFPLAHEAAVAETAEALSALIEEKVSEVEGVSSGELRSLESALRGLINSNVQQQVVRDENQDNVIEALNSALGAEASELRALIADIRGEAEAAKNSVPTGTLIAFASNYEPPDGYLLCNGATVSRTTYAKLFATIGVSYGAGDGSTTFKLPDMDGRVLQGTNNAVKYIEAGLPEIYGMAGDVLWNTHVGVREDGALYYTGLSEGKWAYIGDGDFWSGTASLHVDASRSSSIYGASDTVQPRALALRYYIKY